MTDEELIARLRHGGRIVQGNYAHVAAGRIEALVNEAVLSKAAYEGVSSLLLSVQEDCIKERQRAERLEAALQEIATDEHPLGWIAIAALTQKDRTDG